MILKHTDENIDCVQQMHINQLHTAHLQGMICGAKTVPVQCSAEQQKC